MKRHWLEEARRHLIRVEPRFETIARLHAGGPPAAAPRVDLFGALTHAIVSQQLSSKAAEAIFARLKALFPRRRLSAARMRRLSIGQLRRAGLSRPKIKSLKALSHAHISGQLPSPRDIPRLSDQDLINRLIQLHGIGPWSVHMLMIFKLGRPDIFPTADLGVLKGYQKIFSRRSRPSAAQAERASRRWAPYRTLAAWYCWRAFDTAEFAPSADQALWSFSTRASE